MKIKELSNLILLNGGSTIKNNKVLTIAEIIEDNVKNSCLDPKWAANPYFMAYLLD